MDRHPTRDVSGTTPLQRERSSHVLKDTRPQSRPEGWSTAHKERLSCSILEQKQNLENVTEKMADQRPSAQAAAREIPSGHKDKHLFFTALFFRGTAKGKQTVSNLQTSSQEEATEPCNQPPCSGRLDAMKRSMGHLHPLMPSQGHRCFVFQLMHPAEEKPVHAGEGPVQLTPHPTSPAWAGIQALWVGSHRYLYSQLHQLLPWGCFEPRLSLSLAASPITMQGCTATQGAHGWPVACREVGKKT